MPRATSRLNLNWSVEKQVHAPSRLDEWFLVVHRHSLPTSLPFLPDLHDEVLRFWGKMFSGRDFPPIKLIYAIIQEFEKHGYVKMHQTEE